MKIFNKIFYIVLFVCFSLPNNADFFINIFGMQLQIREIGFILMPILNIFSFQHNMIIISKRLKIFIGLFLFSILLSELIKIIIFNQSTFDIVKEIRVGLPLFSSLIMLFIGINANIYTTWKVLFISVFISGIISVLSIFISLPIYSEIDSTNLLESAGGRFINANAAIGFVGLYLLIIKPDKKTFSPWYILLSFVLILISTFSRTYLIMVVISLIYFMFKNEIIRVFSIFVLSFSLLIISYTISEQIQMQVNKRILSIILAERDISSSVYENNREIIADGVISRLKEGYWLVGMPYNKPIFTWDNNIFENADMRVTDTSFINILLRYGVLSLLFLICIFINMYDKNLKLYNFTFFCFFLISFNADTLFRHNSIFFLIIIYLFSIYDKTKNCSNC